MRSGALAAALMVLTVPGAALADDGQVLKYDVYAGGLHAVEAELTIDRDANTYSTAMDARTRGFLAKMVPWSGRFATDGWVLDDGTMQPELHKYSSLWRGEEEIKEYYYNKDGSFQDLYTKDFGKKRKKEEVDHEITKGTIDTLTGALKVFEQVASTGECSGESLVFDGKRRFKQIFRDKGAEILPDSKYNAYKGQAARCVVEVQPAGGEWHSKPRGWLSIQEQGRDKGTMPTIWVAQLEPGGQAVPIRMMVKTDYGTFFMHLAEYRNEKGTHIADIRK